MIARAFKFFFAFLVDGWFGLSLTRLLAIYFGWMAVEVSVEAKHISGNAVIVIVFCLAAAFGKGTFSLALAKWRASSVSTDSTVNATLRVTSEEIKARRGEDGTEPAGKVPQAFDD